MEEKNLNPATTEEELSSRYTGGAVVRKLISWVAFFVSLITLSLANPAMVCWKQRWECRHTYIDGKRLVFDGKAMQLFGKYLMWILLTIVTIGIYSFWLSVKKKQWITKHTHVFTEEYAKAEIAEEKLKEEKRTDPFANLPPEERAAREEKLHAKKKQAHTFGLGAIVLAFILPPWGFIFAVVGIISGAIYKEKTALRLSTLAAGIVLTVILVAVPFILKLDRLPFIIAAGVTAAVTVGAGVAVFILTKNWESVKMNEDNEEKEEN